MVAGRRPVAAAVGSIVAGVVAGNNPAEVVVDNIVEGVVVDNIHFP